MAEPIVKPPSGDTVLATLEKAHPRLVLKDDDLARLKTLIDKDPLLRKCVRKMLERADGICQEPALVYQKKGPRLLHVSRACVNRIYTLGLAWRLTHNGKYAEKATENLLAVTAFTDWNPSHFLDTAEMSHGVGVGYDWFYHYLDETARERIRTGLIEHGLKQGLSAYFVKKAWWTDVNHNWNQVCNGGLIIGALAVADTHPDYARRIIPHAVADLPKALVEYGPDGAWGEGPGYWNYATSYTVYALAALESALGTDFGLSRIKGVSEAGWFPIYLAGPTGRYFNFADAGTRPAPQRNLPCLFWLARRFDNPAFSTLERRMLRKYPGHPFDVIGYLPEREPPPLELDRHFRGPVEVVTLRSAWNDPNALFLAVKAGFNRVNHGHLDLGSFIIEADGVRWACDLGADDYNLPGYWDGGKPTGRRWQYYRLNSLSHNVPLLKNRNQSLEARTVFRYFKSTPERANAIVDLSSAYPDQADKVERGVALLNRRRLLVQDEFDLKGKSEVAWGMTTQAEIKLDDTRDDRKGTRALLSQEGKRLRVEILSPAGATFTIESAERKPPEQINAGFRRLMIRLPNQSGRLRIAVLLSPVRAHQPAVKPPELKALSVWPDQ